MLLTSFASFVPISIPVFVVSGMMGYDPAGQRMHAAADDALELGE